MPNYKPDCVYYDTRNQRIRAYCHKLTKEIRPSNCDGCGWYSSVSQVMEQVDPVVVRLLRTRTREELGLEKIADDDFKGEDGEAIEAWKKK